MSATGVTLYAPGAAVTLYHFATIGSTQDLARQLARAGARAWTIVIADRQTAGRGRRGRVWLDESAAGLYFTVILRTEMIFERAGVIPLVAGLALAEAVRAETGIDVRLKWPNDLLAPDGRKLAGLLLEAEVKGQELTFALLGIGLNVRQAAFLEGLEAAALEEFAVVNRPALFARLVRTLRERCLELEHGELEGLLARYRGLSETLGRDVRVVLPNGEMMVGRARDIEPSGALLVETAYTVYVVTAGEVSVRHLPISDEESY